MHCGRAIILFFLVSSLLALAQTVPQKQQWTVDTPEGYLTYSNDTRVWIATNGIIAKYGGATLTAQRATGSEITGQVVADGDVRLEREGQVWKGDHVEYNFLTGKMEGEHFRTGQNPFFAEGQYLVGDQKAGVYVGAGGLVTTDDIFGTPGYSVRAKRLVIVPGEYIEAHHAVLYLKDVPVFYFPYFRRTIGPRSNHFTVTPGYRNLFGPFLLTSYNWYWTDKLEGVVHLDGREKRGVGAGPDFDWHLPRYGEGLFRSYYTYDLEPGEDPFTGAPLEHNRYRVWFGHEATIRSNLTAKALVRYQSDAFITRDFFESEYRRNPEPNSFAEVNQLWSNFTLDLVVQPQVNDFFETVERLPDIKLTGLRQQIGQTPLYYETDTSVGYYQRRFAEGTTNEPFSAMRADTWHQVTLPWTFFDWLNVTPRVGGRYTHYGEAGLEGGTTEERDRGVFNTGAETSFKASRLWPAVSSKFWDVDGIRHIVEPSVNYVFVPRPNVLPRELPQFDYLVPTTQLLPIEFPDFNAIDAIDSQNVLRLTLRNKLQTKRKGGVQNLVNWALYTDWRLDPRAGQGTFSDVFSDVDLRPFRWLTFSSQIRYDVNEGFLREAFHRATFAPNDTWSWQVGHWYLESLPGSPPPSGNNTFLSAFYYRLSENWGTRIAHRFEGRDGVLEEQMYTLYRDFRSWTGALTVRIRDRREQSTDYTVAVTFSLKAFPRFNLGEDAVRPSLLMGY